ncbi:MAG TPA: hypothetical protein VFS71_02315 [Flavobacterium sp.]|uniref:hypothetical protein n=1 Tax=Flavobacterium sp. TaxID=239 RepID=UPI002DB82599|nr:hypothetical protein [Flavobacterium sp.]HEU4788493.1 hypothetical protein [Flavobacterium sp.]
MKNYLVLGLVLISFLANAQETQQVSVEKSLNSVQVGLLSLSFQNETRLDRKITLRSEIGLSTGSSTAKYPDGKTETSFLIVPYINIEPRWYYGLDRRNRLNKNTINNGSNYFSLLTTYVPSRMALVNTKDFEAAPFISIIPEYGIRRTSIRKHFYSECSAGIGYRHNFFNKPYTYTIDENEVVINFQFKFGYIF